MRELSQLVVTKERLILAVSEKGETYLSLVVTKEMLILVGSDQGENYPSWQ